MNKKMNILKIIMALILLFLNIKCLSIYGLSSFSILVYLILLLILLLLFINDLLKKITINKTYDILFIIVEVIICFILFRTLYDPSFIYNSSNIISELHNYHFGSNLYDIQYINLMYLNQNSWYLIILIILVLIYRKINLPKTVSKYHIISIICFIISICTTIPSLEYLLGNYNNIIFYLIFNIILVIIEIYRLIKDNYVKKEWIFFIAFLFNLFAFISIFVNLF